MTDTAAWQTEPLGNDVGEVIAFMRSANPFAEHMWGWETGRFIDFRWGGNILRDAADPGFFARHCTLVRRGGELVALIIAETGADDHYLLTPGVDRETLDWALRRLLERRRGERTVLLPWDEAEWIHDVLEGNGFTRGDVVDMAWEFDLDEVPPPFVPDGFAITHVRGAEDHRAIDRVLEGAFGGNKNRLPVLESLATNPAYRPELSIVARDVAGIIAAYCRGTVDPDRGVGSIDPVATHPRYQRRGLGRAVVLRCFAEQRKLGATTSFIGSGAPGSAGGALYATLNPRTSRTYSEWSQRRRPTGHTR